MIFRTLGALDFITVVFILGAAVLPQKFLVYAAIYLVIKGLMFIVFDRDLASYGDLVCGLYLILLSFGLKLPYIHTLVLIYLLQKTILTFIAIGLKTMLFYYEYKDRLQG